jgi:hypothetical protein
LSHTFGRHRFFHNLLTVVLTRVMGVVEGRILTVARRHFTLRLIFIYLNLLLLNSLVSNSVTRHQKDGCVIKFRFVDLCKFRVFGDLIAFHERVALKDALVLRDLIHPQALDLSPPVTLKFDTL